MTYLQTLNKKINDFLIIYSNGCVDILNRNKNRVEGCDIISCLREESGACYLRCNLPQNKEEKVIN